MKHSSVSSRFLVLLLVLAFIAVCILFAPYFSVFVLTLVLGVMFAPVYRWLKTHVGMVASALITTAAIAVVILGPVAFIVTRMVQEASGIVTALGSESQAGSIITLIQDRIDTLVPWANIEVASYVESSFSWFTSQAASIFGGIASVGLTLFLSLFSVAYWFMDGPKFKAAVMTASPLDDTDTKNIFRALSASIHSVIKGKLMISGIQGVIAGLGYVIFGVPNPVLWAALTAICALIPNFGTAIAMIPIIGYLAITGDMGGAIGLSIWGLVAVGLIDNLLGPKLMSRGADVHPVLVLMGILGGIQIFGPVGLFAGPLIVSFFIAVFTAYSHTTARQDTV